MDFLIQKNLIAMKTRIEKICNRKKCKCLVEKEEGVLLFLWCVQLLPPTLLSDHLLPYKLKINYNTLANLKINELIFLMYEYLLQLNEKKKKPTTKQKIEERILTVISLKKQNLNAF